MKLNSFKPGRIWLDSCGNPIQAHGGGILYSQGTYYWFGENKAGPTRPGILHDLCRVDFIGINCYSSQDLYNWKYEGIVLPADQNDPGSDLHPGKVVERPKVIFNSFTGKYVMWVHMDTADYETARAGVAVSEQPTGPYRYLGSQRLNGADCRDCTIFQDQDGKAYLVFASEWNKTIHIVTLDDEYLRPTRTETHVLENRRREAPALFKSGGHYYLITSGCTGWDPNPAEYALANSPLGPWKVMGSPCTGSGVPMTFGSQSTFVFPVIGMRDAFIFMADRWQKEDLGASRYVWLPVRFNGEQIMIEWLDEWNLEMLCQNHSGIT